MKVGRAFTVCTANEGGVAVAMIHLTMNGAYELRSKTLALRLRIDAPTIWKLSTN